MGNVCSCKMIYLMTLEAHQEFSIFLRLYEESLHGNFSSKATSVDSKKKNNC